MISNPFPPGSSISAYLRDSGGEDQDLSVDQQENAARKWAAENNLVISNIFRDIATPGSTAVGREAFQRMIQHFRDPECHEAGIIIWKYSRFARDIDDAQFYKADLRRRGFIIHSLNDSVPNGTDGRFFESAIDWMNERFLEDLSLDVKRGLHHLVEQYGGLGGTPPRGFKREPVNLGNRRDGTPHIVHRWSPDPELWDRCKLAWQMRSTGASYRQIHAATGIYTSINSYKTFYDNRLYLGELCFGDKTITDYVEPMIDQVTWNAVQLLKKKHSVNSPRNHPRRMSSRFLLSGILRCAKCGSPMNGNSSPRALGEYDYYTCSRSNREANCDARKIPKAFLEAEVLNTIRDYILVPEVIGAMITRLRSAAESQAGKTNIKRIKLEADLKRIQKAISNITAAIADAGHSHTLLKKLSTLELEELETKDELNNLVFQVESAPETLTGDQLLAQLDNLKAILAIQDPAMIRNILVAFISRITAERDGKLVFGMIEYYLPPIDDKKNTTNNIISRIGRCPQGDYLQRTKYQFSLKRISANRTDS